MISKSEFFKVARFIKNSYDDFVLGSYIEAKEEGYLPEVYEFMKNNDDLTTDDVCEYIDFLEGYPEPIKVLPTNSSYEHQSNKQAKSRKPVAV